MRRGEGKRREGGREGEEEEEVGGEGERYRFMWEGRGGRKD